MSTRMRRERTRLARRRRKAAVSARSARSAASLASAPSSDLSTASDVAAGAAKWAPRCRDRWRCAFRAGRGEGRDVVVPPGRWRDAELGAFDDRSRKLERRKSARGWRHGACPAVSHAAIDRGDGLVAVPCVDLPEPLGCLTSTAIATIDLGGGLRGRRLRLRRRRRYVNSTSTKPVSRFRRRRTIAVR
jgi:hypothetical protein